jgi:tyrosyl-tRNA synthetase
MLGGLELIRRKLGKYDAAAMTITLLLNSEGKKMGKTEKGAVWLDPEKTSPYDFYQYWRNVSDGDVIKCLKMLTDVPLEEIAVMESWKDSQLNKAKEVLAYELTKLVHGEEEAEKAQKTAQSLFGAGASDADMPTTQLTEGDLTDGKISIIKLLTASNLAASNGEAKKLVKGGGVSVDGEKVSAIDALFEIPADGLVVKKGKKVYRKVTLG